MLVNRPSGVQFGQSSAVKPALPPAVAQKPVLLSTDVDSTYLTWDERRNDFSPAAAKSNAKAIQRERTHLATHINTGRGLTTLKQAAPVLKDMPLDMMSVNNGQDLYVNWQGERADRWLAGLTQADADPFWHQVMKVEHQWEGRKAHQMMVREFAASGFIPLAVDPNPEAAYPGAKAMQKILPGGEKLLLKYFDDQPVFTMGELLPHPDRPSLAYSPAAKNAAENLRERVQARLTATGVQTQHYETETGFEGNRFVVMALTPVGVSKATVVNGLRDYYMPNLKGVITAGDSPYNDVDMLQARTYGKGAQQVNNHPILSGDDAAMREKLADHPRLVNVREGWLAPGIAQHTRRILGDA